MIAMYFITYTYSLAKHLQLEELLVTISYKHTHPPRNSREFVVASCSRYYPSVALYLILFYKSVHTHIFKGIVKQRK